MSLHERIDTDELVDTLYDLLPASKARSNFGTVATTVGLSEAWEGSVDLLKKPRIRSLVVESLRRKALPRFLEEVVTASLSYRKAKGNPLTYNEVSKLSELADRLGQPTATLKDPKFLNKLPGAPLAHLSEAPRSSVGAADQQKNYDSLAPHSPHL